MGIGDWGLGVLGFGGKPHHPNPHTQTPHPKIKKFFFLKIFKIKNKIKKILLKYNKNLNLKFI